MRGKKAKQLRKIAVAGVLIQQKPTEDIKPIYKRLKKIHNSVKGKK